MLKIHHHLTRFTNKPPFQTQHCTMSHTSRRVPPIECPLASLGRNTPSLDTSQTYHHPLSSSPLNPQVYQMSRKSPLLNIGSASDCMYTSSTSSSNINQSTQQDHSADSEVLSQHYNFPSPMNSNVAQHLTAYNKNSPTHRLTNNNPSQINSGLQRHQHPLRPPPQRNYTPLDTIIAYHNERLSPVAERASSSAYHYSSHNRETDHSRRHNNNVVIVNHHDEYFLEDKMDSLYIRSGAIPHPSSSHSNSNINNRTTTERYFLEDNMTNCGAYSVSSRLESDSPNFFRRTSSPSETSGSDRYLIGRENRASPAILSSHNAFRRSTNTTNITNQLKKIHSPSSTSGITLSDGLSRLGRLSPSQDQGYATLVSPSPSSGQQTPGPWNRGGSCRSGPAFDRLPDDAIVLIFAWLDSCDLCRLARVCRRFEKLAWKPVLWKTITLRGLLRFFRHNIFYFNK